MSELLGPGPKSRVRRLPAKATYEADVIFAVIDEAPLCHVASIVNGGAVVIPTLHAREGQTIFLHGSPSNAVMKSIVERGEACVTMTLYDGLRLARSGFESSIAYRSVVVFGAATLVSDDAEKARVLDLFVDAVLPGRSTRHERRRATPHHGGRGRDRRGFGQAVLGSDGRSRRGPRPPGVVRHGAGAHGVLRADPRYERRDGRGNHTGAGVGGAAPGFSVTSLSALRAQIERIDPVDQREADAITTTLERLRAPGDPFSRMGSGHVTASALVVSSRGVILHRHLLLGIWIQPGGHVDTDESPEAAALRETLEETGLVAHHFDPVELLHVDVHPGPRGHRGPKDHLHYDLRYALWAPPLDPSPPDGESPEVGWFDFEVAQERCEPALAPVIAKLAVWYRARDVRE
jgi:nitroimidazol reductase NimA-like FMN-containing flavoprotein (pyridoxamine 5'-phosphate oxidase superfamily)/8-oxo-dGTP pyrophosphatase MutT (NUDIX family)